MESSGGQRGILDRKASSLMFRQVTPPHEWKADSDFHYLRLTIPGFKANDITIHVNKYGQLVVRGQMQMSEHKCLSFEETYELPKNTAIDDASGQFENDQIYCINIPKQKGKSHKLRDENSFGHSINVENAPKFDQRTTSNPKGKPIGQPYDNVESSENPYKLSKTTKNPLSIINSEYSRKTKIIFFVAILVALLVIALTLILKFRH